MSTQKPFRHEGFTLVEHLIAMGLMVLLMLGSYRVGHRWYLRQQLFSETQRLLGFLKQARNYALLHHVTVMICPIEDFQTNQSCLPTANWKKKLAAIISSDDRKNPAKVIFYFKAINAGIQLSWQGFQKSRGVLFTPTFASAASSGRFFLMTPVYQKQIILNRVGRIRSSKLLITTLS